MDLSCPPLSLRSLLVSALLCRRHHLRKHGRRESSKTGLSLNRSHGRSLEASLLSELQKMPICTNYSFPKFITPIVLCLLLSADALLTPWWAHSLRTRRIRRAKRYANTISICKLRAGRVREGGGAASVQHHITTRASIVSYNITLPPCAQYLCYVAQYTQ